MDGAADAGRAGQPAAHWPAAVGALAVGLAGLIGLHWPAAAKAVEIWWTTSAYNHAFLIAPISLYVIWERRRLLARLGPKPALRALLALPIFALPWLAGAVADVYEVQQLALVGLMQVLFLTVLGWPVYRALAFPLLYLWLLVPTGEFLLPGLQDLATAVATEGLRASSLPVYTEGIVIQTASGFYRVEAGCAGLNFLLAALAFSLLFANLIYRGWLKRTLAVAVALAVALAANWVRIYGIILIDHLTGRQTDIVADHLLYGWGFFAVIMLAMIALGLRFRDDDGTAPEPPPPATPGVPPARLAGAALLALALATVAPAYAYLSAAGGAVPAGLALALPAPTGAWRAATTPAPWRPALADADRHAGAGWRAGAARVDLYVAYYWRQRDGHEAAAAPSRLIDDQTAIRLGFASAPARVDGAPLTVAVTRLRTRDDRVIRVWHWYWVDGRFTASRALAKLLEVKARLLFGEPRAALIMLATEEGGDGAAAAAALQRLLDDLPSIGAALQGAG